VSYFILFDVPIEPANRFPWGALILLLLIVFILSVGFVAGLVFLLIRLQRRKAKESQG
jgi:hypothetical protein